MPIKEGNFYILSKKEGNYTKVKVLSTKYNGNYVVQYLDVDNNTKHIAHYTLFSLWINLDKTEKLWKEVKDNGTSDE